MALTNGAAETDAAYLSSCARRCLTPVLLWW